MLTCEDNDQPLVLEWLCDSFIGRRLIGGLSFDWDRPVDREVSSLHGAITWHRASQTWQLRDLGSRNGTTIDGEKLSIGDVADLRIGARIAFGNTFWRVAALSPPPVTAQSRRGELRMAIDEMLLLPDEHAPEVVVTRAGLGWHACPWVDGGPDLDAGKPIEQGASLRTSGRTWTISVPLDGAMLTDRRTVPNQTLGDYRLHLEVAPNREQFEVWFADRGERCLLPDRVYYELWWLLARARLRSDGPQDPDEIGWVDKSTLFAALGMSADDNHLNIWVHRSRAMVHDILGVVDYKELFQRRRRRGSSQLRLGVQHIELIER